MSVIDAGAGVGVAVGAASSETSMALSEYDPSNLSCPQKLR